MPRGVEKVPVKSRPEGCNCDFRTYMLEDGCEVCNPTKGRASRIALTYARETIEGVLNHRNLVRWWDALEPTYSLTPEGRAEIDRIQKALDFNSGHS